MKLHLPIALAAMLVSSTVYAYGPYQTTEIITGGTLSDAVSAEDSRTNSAVLTSDFFEGASDANPKAIVKDGVDKTLTIDSDISLNNLFLIREGRVEVSNATITQTCPTINYTSGFSVGGKDVTLVMDNAHYTVTTHMSSVVLGSMDGSATVELKNGSSIHSTHFFFIGDQDGTGTPYGKRGHVTNSTAGIGSEDLYQSAYNNDNKITKVKVSGASVLSTEQSFQIANADITISGEGSVMRDRTNPMEMNDPASYLAYDGADYANTTITVEDGGMFEGNWNLTTGNSKESTTTIKVIGKSENGVASVFSVAGVADLGGAEATWGRNDIPENETSETTLSIQDGAKGVFNQLEVGSAREAVVTIGKGSVIEAHEDSILPQVTVYSYGSIENAGAIEIDLVMKGGTVTAADGSKFAGIVAESGTLYINGNMTLNGELILGTVDVAETVSADTAAGTVTLMALTNGAVAAEESGDVVTIIYNGEGAIDLGGKALTIGDNVVVKYAEGVDATEGDIALFTNVASAQGLEKIEVQDAEGNKVEGAKVTVTVPEPATATLSLLALAALAARRRRC